MSVESEFYQLENAILTYLGQNFFVIFKEKTKEEQIKLLKDWYQYLDESTKDEQFSSWLSQKTRLESLKEVCKHILECRIDPSFIKEPLPDTDDYKSILDMYARYYVNISLTAQFLGGSLIDDLNTN